MDRFVIVLETDVCNMDEYTKLHHAMHLFPAVKSWTIDTGDCQNVLRIVSSENVSGDVIELLKKARINSVIMGILRKTPDKE